MVQELLVVGLGFLLASNGFLMYMIKKRDKVSTLVKMNNRQAGQIHMLTTAISAVLEAQESLVDALHEKGVLNGNAERTKDRIRTAKSTIDEYSRKVCKEQILMEDK